MTASGAEIGDNRPPVRSRQTATCAWCGHAFDSIVELLGHVETDHVDAGTGEARPAA
jgi:hypothetical protein